MIPIIEFAIFKKISMKSFIIIFLALLSVRIDLKAQDLISVNGKIINENEIGIPFSHIIIKNKKDGTISDQNGIFEIYCSENDTLTISSIGYKRKSCLCIKSLVVVLKEDVVSLDEVVVNSEKMTYTEKRLGNYNSKNVGTQIALSEAAIFIDNQDKISGLLVGLIFKLSKLRFNRGVDRNKALLKNKELLIRANIYKKSNTEFPGNTIDIGDLIAKINKRQQVIKFDLSHHSISFPKEGLFISIEFLGYFDDKEFIPINIISRKGLLQFAPLLSDGHLTPNSYLRNSVGGSWIKNDVYTENAYNNFNFGVLVEFPKAHNNR